ncbi:MAG: hypothetical protein R3F33_08175 [Planctomycetota bacterium]
MAYWDEWKPAEQARLQDDPVLGPRLRRLQAAEAWLHLEAPGAPPCPEPEELFAYGVRFGGGELEESRREEIREHLPWCDSCRAEVESLATPPPSPILDLPLVGPVETPAVPMHRPAVGPGPTGTLLGLRRFLMVAAAAMLIWLLAGPRNRSAWQDQTWPNWPAVRSGETPANFHPRGKVLADAHGGLWQGTIELPTVPHASGYRVRVWQHGAGAFDTGESIAQWDSAVPTLRAAAGLAPGHYTFEAYALLGGVESPIAAHEVQVHQAPAIWSQLEDQKGIARVRTLHADGWFEDARREALRLPDSAARRAYLEQARY